MKRFLQPLTILLPLLCVAAASAQIAPIRFSAPINPVAGLPRLLPSPMTGPLVGTPVSLPSLVPALTPALSFPSAAGVALPVSLPAYGGQIPAAPAKPAGDNVNNPLRRVMPGVTIRFNAPGQAKTAAAQPDSGPDLSKQGLDQAFDGEGQPKPVVEQPRRQPVSSGRHISLPEWDLEKDLGL